MSLRRQIQPTIPPGNLLDVTRVGDTWFLAGTTTVHYGASNIVRTQTPSSTPVPPASLPDFYLTLGPDNIFGGAAAGVPEGIYFPCVSDGYWVKIDDPTFLSLGAHTLQFFAQDGFTQDVTYKITITPLPGTLLLLGTGLLGLLGFGMRKSV